METLCAPPRLSANNILQLLRFRRRRRSDYRRSSDRRSPAESRPFPAEIKQRCKEKFDTAVAGDGLSPPIAFLRSRFPWDDREGAARPCRQSRSPSGSRRRRRCRPPIIGGKLERWSEEGGGGGTSRHFKPGLFVFLKTHHDIFIL